MKTSQEQLKEKLDSALERITPGDQYYHYKNPEQLYEIESIGFREENEGIEVRYRALYGYNFSWSRLIEDFLGTKTLEDGTVVQKFIKIV